jgi:hypothetical protein
MLSNNLSPKSKIRNLKSNLFLLNFTKHQKTLEALKFVVLNLIMWFGVRLLQLSRIKFFLRSNFRKDNLALL